MVLLAINFDNLHQILQNLYTDMMPLCSHMTGVAKGLAGLGALFYVAYRVWQSLARAEPVDVFSPFSVRLRWGYVSCFSPDHRAGHAEQCHVYREKVHIQYWRHRPST